ncbi:MAG: hypothetical protein Q7S03_03750 [bacterium]|nr:hypothetical protein [bacterium]
MKSNTKVKLLPEKELVNIPQTDDGDSKRRVYGTTHNRSQEEMDRPLFKPTTFKWKDVNGKDEKDCADYTRSQP